MTGQECARCARPLGTTRRKKRSGKRKLAEGTLTSPGVKCLMIRRPSGSSSAKNYLNKSWEKTSQFQEFI